LLPAGGIRAIGVSAPQPNATDSGFRAAKTVFCGVIPTQLLCVSELIVDIFRKETGRDLEDYARNYPFERLGIHDDHWKRTPLGEVDTEGGLILPDYELAKLGELYRQLGLWRGVRLLNEDWVRDSVAPRVDLGEGYQYGYHWWLVPYDQGSHHAWSGLGFGGQYVFVMPEDGIVAVATGWAILDPKYNEQTVLDKLRTAGNPPQTS